MSLESDNYLVEKSKDLVWARFSEYTAAELRLLEVYLSKINARDPGSSFVKLSLTEYANIVGVSQIQKKDIDRQLQHFLGNVVTLENKNTGGFEKYTLFTYAKFDPTDADGVGQIGISCNPALNHVFFEIASTGYVRYRLKFTVSMKSQYSIQLYSVLLDSMYISPWSVPVEKLRALLGADSEYYQDFHRFHDKVVKPAVEEINRVSDLDVECFPIRRGRAVKALQFNIRRKQTLQGIEGGKHEGYGTWYSNAVDGKMDAPSCEKLARRVGAAISAKYPDIPALELPNAIYDTINSCYIETVKFRPEDNPIFNIGGYLWNLFEDPDAVDRYMPAKYALDPLKESDT